MAAVLLNIAQWAGDPTVADAEKIGVAWMLAEVGEERLRIESRSVVVDLPLYTCILKGATIDIIPVSASVPIPTPMCYCGLVA